VARDRCEPAGVLGRRSHDRRRRSIDVTDQGRHARHADIWSWFVEECSDVAEFAPRLAAFEGACEEVGRDPATVGKSAGVVVEPTSIGGSEAEFGTPIRGPAEAIADAMRSFALAGFTNLEVVVWPPTRAALDAMAPALELIDAG